MAKTTRGDPEATEGDPFARTGDPVNPPLNTDPGHQWPWPSDLPQYRKLLVPKKHKWPAAPKGHQKSLPPSPGYFPDDANHEYVDLTPNREVMGVVMTTINKI